MYYFGKRLWSSAPTESFRLPYVLHLLKFKITKNVSRGFMLAISISRTVFSITYSCRSNIQAFTLVLCVLDVLLNLLYFSLIQLSIGLNSFYQLSIGMSRGFLFMDYKKAFSGNLLQLRAGHKLSLQALGDILGISNQAVSLLEKGKNVPSFNVLMALANYFDVSIDYLVGRTENPNSHKT